MVCFFFYLVLFCFYGGYICVWNNFLWVMCLIIGDFVGCMLILNLIGLSKIVGILWYNYMVVILLVYFICYVGYKMGVNICNGLMWIYKLNYNYKI